MHLLSALSVALLLPGLTTIPSNLFPGVSISYKETQICETTQGVKAFSGYVNLPPKLIQGQDYPIHSFFWFFEARNDPQNAPLSLWLQGGPGSPSVVAALGENGPCSVTENSKDTVLNSWSWNNNANMLYLDQPVQVGFSYDTLVNGTINETSSPFGVTVKTLSPADLSRDNLTSLAGTFASQNNATTANTTFVAARANWYFLQAWMQEYAFLLSPPTTTCLTHGDRFPEYKTKDNRLSIWGESYGGHYAPTFADYINSQNTLIASGNISTAAVPLHVDTLGLVNACVDNSVQTPTYPVFAYNNTYGLSVINATEYQTALAAVPKCLNLTDTCRALADELDPEGWGNNPTVNAACRAAYGFCFGSPLQPFNAHGHDQFDFTQTTPNPFPPKFAAGYLNSREVQLALGVPLNFTGLSSAVSQIFIAGTGDFIRGHNLKILGQLLDRGVKVALMYGDRDYQCNWLGGEQLSLAIESSSAAGFRAAGYAYITTNETYTGGVVRQHGNLSFSRVFDAGHQVPYYQPETAYRIFQRATSGSDIATGHLVTTNTNYCTAGPSSSFGIKNAVPPPPTPLCYVWDVLETCTAAQTALLANGSAVVREFIMVGYKRPDGTEVLYAAGGGNSSSTGGRPVAPVVSGVGGRGAVWEAVVGMLVVVVSVFGLV
ncbi:Alpha/Beta hydrolase protein [Mycena capillaripes]|nr:Alpha/Beta hydrolase protein [Mycena capillaripes]